MNSKCLFKPILFNKRKTCAVKNGSDNTKYKTDLRVTNRDITLNLSVQKSETLTF